MPRRGRRRRRRPAALGIHRPARAGHRRFSRPCCCTGTCLAATRRAPGATWPYCGAERHRPAPARHPAGRQRRAVASWSRSVPADTGFPRADVENDFVRARRRQVLARLARRLRRGPDDVNLILPFDEVVAALGRRGERRSACGRFGWPRWSARLTQAAISTGGSGPRPAGCGSGGSGSRRPQRRGESIPPIDVYRVGEMHFVHDGHHRVSIALATGQQTIDAYVTEALTVFPAGACITAATCC